MGAHVSRGVCAVLLAGVFLVSAGGAPRTEPHEQQQQRQELREEQETRLPSTPRPPHLCPVHVNPNAASIPAPEPIVHETGFDLAPPIAVAPVSGAVSAGIVRQLPPLASPPPPAPPAPQPPSPPAPPAPQPPTTGLGGSPAALPSDFNTEEYGVIDEAGFVGVVHSPLSTFSIDVDTAAYANVRRFLRDWSLPPADAVRIEELINYFDYDYPHPEAGVPFGIVTEMAAAPWAPTHQLVHIGLRSTPVATADLPRNNLVFLLDVSGSMSDPDKLPLLKEGFALLVEQLRPQDQVAIVVYAGAAGMVLPPTPGTQKEQILDTLSRLEAGGSTAGGAGICLAYELAREHFLEDGNNRVILATDGDFNVGVSSDGELVELIEWERESGVYLTVLGFGTGNLQDARMEQLADHGNGNYAYIDSLLEAQRVLVEQMGATLVTVAKDVKLQVEFNPALVKAYRLIGYENRRLRDEEFNDDTRDAGDLGAGHSVTALYEIIPAGSDELVPGVDPLRYQEIAPRPEVGVDEVLTVKLRYKRPDETESRLLTRTLMKPAAGDGPSEVFRFASAVAEFGLLLRDSPFQGEASYERARERARDAVGADADGRRSELLSLIRTADLLTNDLLSLVRAADDLIPDQPRTVRLESGEFPRLRLSGLRDGTYAIDAAAGSESFDPVLHLYRLVGARLVAIASDDDGGAKYRDSRIVASLTGSETYLVGVQEYSGGSGSVTLSVRELE